MAFKVKLDGVMESFVEILKANCIVMEAGNILNFRGAKYFRLKIY